MVTQLNEWLATPVCTPDDNARASAEFRQLALTKPAGALGHLETVAIRLAALQGTLHPRVERVHITVFAADHGVAAEGVSVYPQAVTGEMVRNFARGGAAINVLARELNATLSVVDLGTVNELEPLPGVTRRRLGACSGNFAIMPAMTPEQLAGALDAGREAVRAAVDLQADLFIGGEMGIGNTTSAAALACALLDQPAHVLAGPGTGLDRRGVVHKVDIINGALALHRPHFSSALEILRRVGGFEIAALAGSYIACAQAGLPALVDGFIASAAALAAARICPGIEPWLLFSHASAEPGHRAILHAFRAHPLLDLGMRLGEGSGAAVAVPLLRLACALHNGMTTFAEAGVTERST